ncbi:hypothetical protein APR04_003778 [Promicromonospora umidemergens]|uniref:Uncharacterized protein n=1 Tax=Promicromonospora umidemergens TaxID=629679 RepID=A0ABP8XFW0_9MICO|nr:hypothetical protein [Promicromonospora umidemergens]MCP2284855.1 hypothetical protein [Promicromonospora umidemergens]
MSATEYTRVCGAPPCGKSFTTTNVRKKYCDHTCRAVAQRAVVAANAVNVRVLAAKKALRALAETADAAGPEAWNAAWDEVEAEVDDIVRTFFPGRAP